MKKIHQPPSKIKLKSAEEVSEFDENLINTVREPLIALDKNLRVVKANRSFYDFFMVTPDETIGTLIYDLGNNQWDIPKLRELLETILPEKTTFDNYEVEHNFDTIGKQFMLLNARKIQRGWGKEPTILLAIEDITERKRTELIIQQQNEQLQELNATKDKFFSIIAHDLRSPLTGFLGLTQIIAEEASKISAQELSQLGSTMHQAADNLFKLLQNLLEWSQMQNGSISLIQKDILLTNMIAKNLESIKMRCELKGISINNMVTNQIHAYADEKMISSVLLNLLSNAVKFTHRNGAVTVSAKEIKDQMIEVSIKDTGIGIPKNMVEKLFKLGEKTGRKGTDGELSTGLGLLLCKEFIDKNGGKLWVVSEEGVGSTFYFTLPTKTH